MKYEFKGTQGTLKIHKMFNSPLMSVSEEFGEMHHLDAYIVREGDNKILGIAKYCTVHAGFPQVDDIGEFESNASLFAGAPELLEACIAVYEKLMKIYDSEKADTDWYNNNMPNVGGSLPYKEYQKIPEYVLQLKSAIHKALNIQK